MECSPRDFRQYTIAPGATPSVAPAAL